MTLKSMQVIEDHECDDEKQVDVDICAECGDHSGFCSVCGLSTCCGAGTPYLD